MYTFNAVPDGDCLQPKHVAGNNGNKKCVVMTTESIGLLMYYI
jgi:hypothetical protein